MICPDCILEMNIETRKPYKRIGKRKFYVCPKCGYNIAVASQEIYDRKELEIIRENFKEQQEQNYFKEN